VTGNFFADDVGGVLSKAITETDGDAYIVNPTEESVPDIIFRLHDQSDPPTVKLLADKDVLKEAMADFLVSGHAADLTAAETLSIRWAESVPGGSVLVSNGLVVSFVRTSERVGGLSTRASPFVGAAVDQFHDRWEAADEYRLRSPPISEVRETLAEEIGDAAAADFDAILDELPEVSGDGDGIDEVTISLLVAARHGVLLYDISHWGEDVGLASKATFSRTKGVLEDSGVIMTEKVPIDVGRPRLRLRLNTGRLRNADVAELTGLVRDRVATVE
jgi:hypothetical protein